MIKETKKSNPGRENEMTESGFAASMPCDRRTA
ncbi:unnamed protein product [Victoria cruziana]